MVHTVHWSHPSWGNADNRPGCTSGTCSQSQQKRSAEFQHPDPLQTWTRTLCGSYRNQSRLQPHLHVFEHRKPTAAKTGPTPRHWSTSNPLRYPTGTVLTKCKWCKSAELAYPLGTDSDSNLASMLATYWYPNTSRICRGGDSPAVRLL